MPVNYADKVKAPATTNLGFEAKLRLAADSGMRDCANRSSEAKNKLRSNLADFIIANGRIIEPVWRRRCRSRHGRWPTSWTAWPPSPANSFTALRFPPTLGFRGKTKPTRIASQHLRKMLFIDLRKGNAHIERVRRERIDSTSHSHGNS